MSCHEVQSGDDHMNICSDAKGWFYEDLELEQIIGRASKAIFFF